MNIHVSESRLQTFLINIAQGVGIGTYYYNRDSSVHPKLIKYLTENFDSFNTVLISALSYAKKKHDSYIGLLVESNRLTRVGFESDKFIFKLNHWESVCTADNLTMELFEKALVSTRNIEEAGIVCGLELDDLLDFKGNDRIKTLMDTFKIKE